ncbi:aldehyde dehydrogenase [Actinoplanes sp. L3-i22]|uniref:aldehyde dehydrogenase family protein n=1 Tax=Actinoplanes sp. L3-i22 TaxID=2836373 RepID=UPI001C79537E|nr:aldehyde dehydrogenase family protein [Actinoplanes sp. L3-i22]BCY13345.1 aldehyde dehydrogenase [Actinoplanes sp. L3-i22]
MPHDDRLEGNLIAGSWRPATTDARILNANPGDTGDEIGFFPDSSPADVDAAVDAAGKARAGWQALGPVKRGAVLRRAADLIRVRAEDFARSITREQGKLLREARSEVARTIELIDYIAGEGRRLGGSTLPADDDDTLAITVRRPIGVVGLITPWNFPLAIPAWKVAPALLSGCTVVLKPSPLAPLTAALLADVLVEAGVTPGALNLVQGDRVAGEALVGHPAVAGISFTGSVPVGRLIAGAAGGRMAATQLELGGKNAAIVLADADLERAADAVVAGAFGQAGQRCSATSRVVVDRAVAPEFVEAVAARVARLRVGYGLDDTADVGPVVSAPRLDVCERAVHRAVADGARLVAGGQRASADRPGHYFQPTVLADVEPYTAIAQEEIFGPVLSVIECDGPDQAVDIVNAVEYGMSAAVHTRDLRSALVAFERIEAGMFHVNRATVGAYPHMPHVGAKASQFGPAECSPETWDFYTRIHSACISY